MASSRNRYKHLFLKNTAIPEPYKPIGRGGSDEVRSIEDRHSHGSNLLCKFEKLQIEMDQAHFKQESSGMDKGGFGLQLEVESFSDVELKFESLARERSGIELLNVKTNKYQTTATIFVPDKKLHILENLVKAYLDESKDKLNKRTGSKKPRNQKLIDTIKNIKGFIRLTILKDACWQI